VTGTRFHDGVQGIEVLHAAAVHCLVADPGRLAKVSAPALFLVGDRDRMCPAEGCRKTWQVGAAAAASIMMQCATWIAVTWGCATYQH
jgi:pimeloyl-ACP methyl ester carboxylesterase